MSLFLNSNLFDSKAKHNLLCFEFYDLLLFFNGQKTPIMIVSLKKVLIFIQLIIYLSAINANLVAWIEYNINYDFIVKFLCIQKDEPENLCHGSCHLKKNLEQNEEQNKPANKQNHELPNYSISYHIENYKDENGILTSKTQKYISFISIDIPSNIIEPDFPPPKLL